jgi:heat shock protein HslJ
MNKACTLLVALFTFACGTSSPSSPSVTSSPPRETSLEGSWKLVALEGTPIVETQRFTIAFEGEAIEGRGACNGFWGTAKGTGNQLVLETANTERACALVAQEDAYFEALRKTRSFSITCDVLELLSDTGATLISFQR